jgi:hypothetical protein
LSLVGAKGIAAFLPFVDNADPAFLAEDFFTGILLFGAVFLLFEFVVAISSPLQ